MKSLNRDEAAEEWVLTPDLCSYDEFGYTIICGEDVEDIRDSSFKAGWDSAIEYALENEEFQGQILQGAKKLLEKYSLDKTPLERVLNYGKDTSGNGYLVHEFGQIPTQSVSLVELNGPEDPNPYKPHAPGVFTKSVNGNKIAKGKVEVVNNLTGRYKTS